MGVYASLRKASRKAIAGLLALTLICSLVTVYNVENVDAATKTKSMTQLLNVQPINLGNNKTFQLTNVSLVSTAGGNIVSFEINVANNGSTSIDFLDYWFRVYNSSGQSFSVKPLGDTKNVRKVNPNSTKLLTYYANVGNTPLRSLVLHAVKFDFNKPSTNYETTVGKISLAKVPLSVPKNSYQIIKLNGSDVNTKILASEVVLDEKNVNLTIKFNFNNTGKKPVTIPVYKYYLLTKDGYSFAVDKNEESLTLSPKVYNHLTLTSQIPLSFRNSQFMLVVVSEDGTEGSKVEVPVGVFDLPQLKTQPSTTGKEVKTFNFKYNELPYKLDFKSAQRVAWLSQDVLSLKFLVQNDGKDTVTVPSLTGTLLLDDLYKVETNVIQSDKTITIGSKKYKEYTAVAQIPYNSTFEWLSLQVDSLKDEKPVSLGRLKLKKSVLTGPATITGSKLTLNNDGNNTNLVLRNYKVYKALNENLVTIEGELSNEESRLSSLTKPAAMLKTPDGQYFPVEIELQNQPLNSKNKAKFTISSKLPKNVDTATLSLIVGHAVKDGKFVVNNDAGDFVLNATVMKLPVENGLKSSSLNIDSFPYTLSISKVTPYVTPSNLNVKLEYTLKRDLSFESFAKDSKLTVALEYEDGEGSFSQDISFEAESGSTFKVGDKLKLSLDQAISDFEGAIKNKPYYMVIYENYKGFKRAIVKKEIIWYADNEE